MGRGGQDIGDEKTKDNQKRAKKQKMKESTSMQWALPDHFQRPIISSSPVAATEKAKNK